MFVASIMTIVVSVSSKLLPPPQGINDDRSLGANFCYREVKRVSQQLILSLEVEVRTGRPLVPRKK